MRELVCRAREAQRRRFAGDGATTTNAPMSPQQVRQFCKLDDPGEALLKQTMTEMGLSAHAHDKVLCIARTIADLAGEENIPSYSLARPGPPLTATLFSRPMSTTSWGSR